MPPKENDFPGFAVSTQKNGLSHGEVIFFANSTPQKLPLWASVQGLRQKLPQVLGTTGFAAPEQYGIGRATGGGPVLRGLRQRRLKLDDVIEEYTQEILDNWDDSPP